MAEPADNAPRFGQRIRGRYYRARLAVCAVIRHAAGEIALVEAGRLFLPGGGLQQGEIPEAALIREVQEEGARTIRIETKLGEAIQYVSTAHHDYELRGTFYTATFTGAATGDAEHRLRWLRPLEAARVVFHESHAWAIRAAARARRSPDSTGCRSPGAP